MKTPVLIAILFSLHSAGLDAQFDRTFEFGPGNSDARTDVISEAVAYNGLTGYGFDFENRDRVRFGVSGSEGSGYCTAEVPFYFSVKVPEGNYEVTVLLGNPEQKSVTTIKAEARRIMLLNHELRKGELERVRFIVNVRSPVIEGTDSIRLKPREYNYMNWDDRLTLEFSGMNQAVRSIRVRTVTGLPTLFLAGNSTVTDQDLEPWASWGQMITRYLDPGLAVANFAESGESLASFKGSGRLRKVMSLIGPGDYLFIEFGHNDQKRKGEGIGPWTSFSDLLREFANLAREKGAFPVFITPTQRRSFDDSGHISPTHGDYPAAMRNVAVELQVPLIDLQQMTKILYEAWGPETSRKAFVHYPAGTFPGQETELKDNTHFNAFGANEIALCVLKGIMELDLPIEDHIINFPVGYDPANPSDPAVWDLPESPRYISTKPEGN
jgi:lysophospholipase L1-like esterase